jgi:hypothetical protein
MKIKPTLGCDNSIFGWLFSDLELNLYQISKQHLEKCKRGRRSFKEHYSWVSFQMFLWFL